MPRPDTTVSSIHRSLNELPRRAFIDNESPFVCNWSMEWDEFCNGQFRSINHVELNCNVE
jgi:hypothetical protein